MNFTNFVDRVQTEIEKKIGTDYYVDILEFQENNGIASAGLYVGKGLNGIAPVIRMDSYFVQCQNGMAMDDIVSDIINTVQDDTMGQSLSMEDILNFSQMKERIILRLINTEANRQMLDNVPHRGWMDISVVYYLLLGRDTSGQMTTLISNELIHEWGVKAEDLYDVAHENMKRLFPVEIRSMSEVMAEILEETLGEDSDREWIEPLVGSDVTPTYVLGNGTGLYGAGGILPGLGIEDFANKLGTDLIVLPSSVHEVILVPAKEGMDLDGMAMIVKNINQTQVPMNDRLSDSIYYFRRGSGMKQVRLSDSLSGMEETKDV